MSGLRDRPLPPGEFTKELKEELRRALEDAAEDSARFEFEDQGESGGILYLLAQEEYETPNFVVKLEIERLLILDAPGSPRTTTGAARSYRGPTGRRPETMARMTAWAGLHGTTEVSDLFGLVRAFGEAAEEAEKAGCETRLVEEDVGDHEVEISGGAEAVSKAADAFAERGFDPVVTPADEAELVFFEADGNLHENASLGHRW